MPTSATDILSLATAKEQLRITTDDADDIVTTAIQGAVAFVSDATGADLEAIAQSPTLKQAVIAVTRSLYNGFEDIPPNHVAYALMNVGACR